LVILLAAISLHRIGFGLLLILAFSAGMAAVLAGIGLMLVYAGRVMERFQSQNRLVGAVSAALPVTTALVVLVSGLVVTARAAFQVGLL
jgi:ABC-type nickel/cobalt efflux system permease component RcnA